MAPDAKKLFKFSGYHATYKMFSKNVISDILTVFVYLVSIL